MRGPKALSPHAEETAPTKRILTDSPARVQREGNHVARHDAQWIDDAVPHTLEFVRAERELRAAEDQRFRPPFPQRIRETDE